MAPKKEAHELILEGTFKAKCTCGNWKYVGILPETKKAINEIHKFHLWGHFKPKKAKRK